MGVKNIRINQIKVGALLSFIQMGLHAIISLVYTPIMLHYLGNSEYGLYNTVSSTISMLSILNLGFNSSYIKFFAEYKKKNDLGAIRKLNGLFLTLFVVIGCVALLCGVFLSNHLDIIFKTGLTENEYSIAKVLMLLLTLSLSVSFPMSVFSNIISAHERFVLLKSLNMVKTVFGPLITLPLLVMGYRSVAMVIVSIFINFIVDLIFYIYVIYVLKQKFEFSNFDMTLFRELFKYTSFIAINIVVEQINWNIDKILLGRYKGTSEVAIYSVGFTLHQHFTSCSTVISGFFTPKIHEIVQQNKATRELMNKKLTNLFTKVGRIQFLILSLIGSGLIFFGKPFILFWAGDGFEKSYYVALLLTLPAMIPLIQNVGIEIQRAENKHHFRSIAYGIMAFFNLISSILLCPKYGATGAAIGTAVSLIIANGLIMNVYYYKKCGIDVLIFWRNILLLSKGLVIPTIFGIFLNNYVKYTNYIVLVVFIIVYTFVFILSIWKLGLNDYEKKLFTTPVHKICIHLSFSHKLLK